MKERKQIYLALEELDFVWCIEEVEKVVHLWADGMNLWEIANEMKRDPDEVAVLIMDLARKNRIVSRPVIAIGRRRNKDDRIKSASG